MRHIRLQGTGIKQAARAQVGQPRFTIPHAPLPRCAPQVGFEGSEACAAMLATLRGMGYATQVRQYTFSLCPTLGSPFGPPLSPPSPILWPTSWPRWVAPFRARL
jgi:hypothetical protein